MREGFGASVWICILSVKHFLRRPDGQFRTSKLAKKVWLHWAVEDCKYQFSFRCSAWIAKLGRAASHLKKVSVQVV